MTWFEIGVLTFVALVVVGWMCSRSTRRTNDQIVETLGRVPAHQRSRHDPRESERG